MTCSTTSARWGTSNLDRPCHAQTHGAGAAAIPWRSPPSYPLPARRRARGFGHRPRGTAEHVRVSDGRIASDTAVHTAAKDSMRGQRGGDTQLSSMAERIWTLARSISLAGSAHQRQWHSERTRQGGSVESHHCRTGQADLAACRCWGMQRFRSWAAAMPRSRPTAGQAPHAGSGKLQLLTRPAELRQTSWQRRGKPADSEPLKTP